jgi:hypothetical protein
MISDLGKEVIALYARQQLSNRVLENISKETQNIKDSIFIICVVYSSFKYETTHMIIISIFLIARYRSQVPWLNEG